MCQSKFNLSRSAKKILFTPPPQNIIWHKAQEKDFCYNPNMAFGSILSNFTSKTKSDEVLAVSRYSSITLFYNRG
jgi:hypothetical protein